MTNNIFYSKYFENFNKYTRNLDLDKIKKIEKLILQTSKKKTKK